MLQVEKKRRKRLPMWAAAAALLLIMAGSAVLILRTVQEGESLSEYEKTGGSLADRDLSEIARITIAMRGREPWTAVRNPEGRMVMADDGWSIDETLGERIEDALANLVYEHVLTEDPDEYRGRLAEFGLEEPELIAQVVYSDGSEITIRIGDKSGLEDEDFRFMTVDGDNRLYAVAGSLVDDLRVEKELLHPVKQPEIQTARLDRITVLDENGTKKAEWVLRGTITDIDAAENWTVNVPVIYPADQEAAGNLKKNVGNLRMGLYVAEATEENLREYGLDVPSAVIEIHLAAGTTGQISRQGAYTVQEREEQTMRFPIGKSRNEMTDYTLFSGAVYSINHFTVTAVTELDPMETLARYPVVEDLSVLSGLTVEQADGTADHYELIRESHPSETENGENATAISCRKNGKEISYEAFEAAYERLRVVTYSGRLPEGWIKKETTLRYIFQTVSGNTRTVELSPWDGIHDAVTVDGETLFYLINGGLGELP